METEISGSTKYMLKVPREEFECEFCSLEFRTAKKWNNHIIQHFKQKNCPDCGNVLIRVGNIWYGPHTSHACGKNSSTETIIEVQHTEEIILPDFIEVKDDEMYDVIDESDVDNDIFEDSATGSDVRASSDEAQPYSMKQLKKDVTSIENNENTTQLTSLTEEQLQKRVCPICDKVIKNKQNLVCHINIHNGIKPFRCICGKSFAHIRNLVRHKEQQRHFDTEFKCKAKGCKKSFMSANKLSRHVKISHSAYESNSIDRPFLCGHKNCGKGFFTSGFLKMHLRLCHSG